MEENFIELYETGQNVVNYFMDELKGSDGRIRVEDLISAVSTVVGERCIEAAGDFNLHQHTFTPGQAVFSEKVTELLTGDLGTYEWTSYPDDSVCGFLSTIILNKGYQQSDLPSMQDVFKSFAAGVGKPDEWGKVPLSVPKENFPFILPLRIGFETRTDIDKILDKVGDNKKSRLLASTFGLAIVLIKTSEAIDKSIALMLAMETVNGMAKTAPMTLEAFNQVIEKK